MEASGSFRRADTGRDAPPLEVPDVPCSTIDEVIRAYQRHVFRFVARAGMGDDTPDVVQEVFLALDQRFRGKPIPCGVRSIVFTCAWRKVLDRARVRARERARGCDLADAEEVPASRSRLDDNVGMARTARAALAQLSEEDQILVRIGVGDDDERGALITAAGAMGLSVDALRARLKRARAKLRDAIRRVAGRDVGDDE